MKSLLLIVMVISGATSWAQETQENNQSENSIVISYDSLKVNSLPATIISSPRFTLGNQPLFVLNNKIIAYEKIKDMDPNQIKSIEVLKDSSATARFGEPGRYGVVIIHTKDGIIKNNENK